VAYRYHENISGEELLHLNPDETNKKG